MKFEIYSDENDLNIWKEAHERHIQTGPDILSIFAPEKNLSFKTTFMPGGEIGHLHCIIGGELATIGGIEISPEDWSDLSKSLTTRNTPPIKGKSNLEAFAEKTLKTQRSASKKKRRQYEKTGDHEIVIKYILDDYSRETMKEPWVVDVLATWQRENRKDLFHKLAHPQGQPRTPYSKKLENLIFVDRIDRYKAEQGNNLTAAIITEMQRLGFDNLTGEKRERKFNEIKNDYERYKKIPTLCRVVEGPDYYELILYSSKITQGGHPLARGTLKYHFPKK